MRTWNDWLARAVDAYGRVDVLVNNAGQGLHVPIEELDPADLRAVFELNVIAPLVRDADRVPVHAVASRPGPSST